jgi:hypothetical protein
LLLPLLVELLVDSDGEALTPPSVPPVLVPPVSVPPVLLQVQSNFLQVSLAEGEGDVRVSLGVGVGDGLGDSLTVADGVGDGLGVSFRTTPMSSGTGKDSAFSPLSATSM